MAALNPARPPNQFDLVQSKSKSPSFNTTPDDVLESHLFPLLGIGDLTRLGAASKFLREVSGIPSSSADAHGPALQCLCAPSEDIRKQNRS
jgi:hypothetical protein